MRDNTFNHNQLPLIQDGPVRDDWVSDLKAGASGLDDLVRMGHLSEEEAAQLTSVISTFKFRVGRYYLSLIDWSDPACPI